MYKFLLLSLVVTFVSGHGNDGLLGGLGLNVLNTNVEDNNIANNILSFVPTVVSGLPVNVNNIVPLKRSFKYRTFNNYNKNYGYSGSYRNMMKGRSLPNYETNNYYKPYGYSNGKYRFFPLVDVDINRFSPFVPFGQIPFGVHPGFINQFPVSTLAASTATNQNSEQNANIIGDKNNVEQNSDQVSKDTVSENVN